MTTNSSIRRAVRCALFAGAAAAAGLSVAQAQDENIQEVVVTGSRISAPNMTSISPVTAIGAEDIAATGKVRIEDIIDKDPPLNGSATCPTGPCNGNTWPQMYDTLGRQIFGLITIDF